LLGHLPHLQVAMLFDKLSHQLPPFRGKLRWNKLNFSPLFSSSCAVAAISSLKLIHSSLCSVPGNGLIICQRLAPLDRFLNAL
jgi:hypothetical protein